MDFVEIHSIFHGNPQLSCCTVLGQAIVLALNSKAKYSAYAGYMFCLPG